MSPSDVDSLLSTLKKLPGEIKSLLEKRLELFIIEIGERVTGKIVNIMYRVMGLVFLLLGMILILVAAAKYAGELLGSESLGFLVVSAPLLVLGFLFVQRRPRSMVKRTRDKMLQQFMNDLSDQISHIDVDIDAENDNKTTNKGVKETREEPVTGPQSGKPNNSQDEKK